MAVFDLEAVIKLTDQGFKSGLSKAGNAVKTFGKVAGVAIGAGAVAVAGLVKQSVDAYAEYEQLAGGVRKLFGNAGMSLNDYAASVGKTSRQAVVEWQNLGKAQRTVLENANQAYLTAGMSANEYIDNVTGISAALINSYGGDTVEAAKQADKAMRAISDNFNTFGGDIEGVKSAYQGFAKQNYTMLDNLKLGYGGTKTEMERLIADANQYREELGLTGDLTIDKYGDIVEAIDLIQRKQGIAGTTAAEAAKTISGSLNMTKAAWKNLVRAFSDKDADLGQYFSALVTSAETAFNNIMPVVEQALTGIGDFISDIAPVIGEKLPGLISSGLPKLISAGAGIVSSLISGIGQALPALVAALPDIFNAIKDGFVDAWPAIKEAGGQLMTMAGEGMKAAGEKIKEVAGNVWDGIKSGVAEKWEGIKGAVSEAWENVKNGTAWDSIKGAVSSAWTAIEGDISGAWEGIKGAVSAAWESVKTGTAWESITSNVSAAWGAIESGVASAWAGIRSAVIIAWGKVKSAPAWSSISSKVSEAWTAIEGAVSGAWAAITTAVSTAVEPVIAAVSGPVEGLIGTVSGVWDSIAGAVAGAWETITTNVTSAVAPVVSAVSGPIEGLIGTVSGVWSSIEGGIAGAWDAIKTALDTALGPIKGLLDFSWSLPEIKLPKLPKLNVEMASAFGGAITYPKLSWAAKAMETPYLFTGATLFGAGEVGDEVLYGRNALMSDISTVVGVSNNALAARLDALLSVVNDYLPEAAKRPVVLDSGALVGGIGYDMDGFLGGYSEMGGRGLSLA